MEVNIVNYNYDSIKYFIRVASNGSLSKAANSLGISQSALSQSMKNLEQSLKVKLFNRNTRGIILTREGKTLYEIAKIGDEYYRNAIIQTLRINQSITLKTFKITASHSLLETYIMPVMNNLVTKYSDVNFEITPHIKETDIVNKLQNEFVDLIINKSDEEFILKEIFSKKITEHNYYFMYNPNYYDFKGTESISDISNHTIILKDRTGVNDNSWVKVSFKQLITCRSDENIMDLVKKGVGIGLCPKELAEKEGLKILNLKDYIPTKRCINAFYIESNDIARDFVAEIINSIK